MIQYNMGGIGSREMLDLDFANVMILGIDTIVES